MVSFLINIEYNLGLASESFLLIKNKFFQASAKGAFLLKMLVFRVGGASIRNFLFELKKFFG